MRLLALIYLAAFASLAVQIEALAGSGGIFPLTEQRGWAVADQGSLAVLAYPSLFWLAAGVTILWQVLIIATSNHNFFNLLTIALCLFLLDDWAVEMLPFPLRERYERWLLDANAAQRPIVLLEAVSGTEPLAMGRAPSWSCALGDERAMDQDQRSALEAQVRARAGQMGRSQWFRREADGSGMTLAAREAMPGQRTEAYGGRWLEMVGKPLCRSAAPARIRR